ncbi:hypothetical protein [Leptospira yasudae]|nr:hypothetical protein [Leptospira yasudae]
MANSVSPALFTICKIVVSSGGTGCNQARIIRTAKNTSVLAVS